MKKWTTALCVLLVFAVNGQQRQVSFTDIDQRVESVQPAPPAELAQTLTKDFLTDREKFRAIFSWITQHIAYRVKRNPRSVIVSTGVRAFPDDGQWKSANDVVAETVLQNGSAVCDGYARLFTSLCNYAGLKSAVITGFAKGDYSRPLTFRCNHTWNAVYLDSTWQLLDVTWASGYTNYRGDEFIRRFDDTYFMPSPETFLHDHFPDDIRWSLLQNPGVPHEFREAPYHNRSFSKYHIKTYYPTAGIIEASVGDTIRLVLETGDVQADARVGADTIPLLDSCLQRTFFAVAFAEPKSIAGNDRRLEYDFVVQDPNIEWLHVVYNHDAILRYRVRIAKEKNALVGQPPVLAPTVAAGP